MARTRWPPGPVNPGLLPRPGRSDRQRRWVPKTGARPTDRYQDSPSGVGRFGGQAGTRSRPYAHAEPRPGRQGRSTHPHPPCRIFVPFRASALRGCRAHISRLWRVGCLCPGGLPQISPGITLRSLGEGMADLDGRGPRRGVLAHGPPGGCGSQCLALDTDTDPRWAACSARTTLMRRSGGPVMAGSGRAGVEAGGSGTRGFRIKTKTRASPAFGPLV